MGTQDLQPNDGIEILDADTEDEGTSFEDIYAFLLSNDDIILTIDAAAEAELRRGLSVVKHNHTKRLKAAGEEVKEKQMKFKVLGEVTGSEPKQIRIQIWLVHRSSVHIHKMVVSDKGL